MAKNKNPKELPAANKKNKAVSKVSYNEDSIAREPAVLYEKAPLASKNRPSQRKSGFARMKNPAANKGKGEAILSKRSSKPESQMTTFEKIYLVFQGISKKDLLNLKEKSGLDYDKLAKVLSVARATLINKKDEEKFSQDLSEKIVSVADIYSYGYEVFEDEGRFNSWVFRPNRALGGEAPYHFLDSQFGREEIRNLIGRIDYGVYA